MSVPEVKDFDNLARLMDPIIDQDWCVGQLADMRASGNRASDVGKPSQEVQVIENCGSKGFGGSREVSPGVLDDLLKLG